MINRTYAVGRFTPFHPPVAAHQALKIQEHFVRRGRDGGR